MAAGPSGAVFENIIETSFLNLDSILQETVREKGTLLSAEDICRSFKLLALWNICVKDFAAYV